MNQEKVSAQADLRETHFNDQASQPNQSAGPSRSQGGSLPSLKPRPATERQRALLSKILENTPYEEIEQMSFDQADRLIAWNAEHWREYPATLRQEVFLRNWNQWKAGLSRGEAADLIAAIKAKTATMTPDELSQAIAHAQPKDWQPTNA